MFKLEDEVLKNLRCKSCSNYLSVSPIILMKDGKNVCGRCVQYQKEHDITEFEGSRNNIYEHIISIIKFPCQYDDRGCKETFVSTHVGEHEQNCSFRIYNCPMFLTPTRCNWLGQRNEIREHFTKEHSDNITQYPCMYKPPINKSMEENFLMTMCGFNFLLQIKVDGEKGKMWHRIRFLGEPYFANLFSFSLEIKGLNCSVQKTSPIQMKETFVLNDCMVTDIGSIKEILGNYETLEFKIRIVMNNTKSQSDAIEKSIESESCNEIQLMNKRSDDSILAEMKDKRRDAGDDGLDGNETSLCEKLRCGKCQAYLSYGPIMMTINDGLNICGRCYEIIKEKNTMVRNEVYELVAPFIQYPCQYDRQGCRKILTWDMVGDHEKHCYYSSYQCPIITDGKLCSWINCKDNLKIHFLQNHPKLIVENSCTFKPDIHYINEAHFLISAYGLSFLLQVKSLGARSKIYHRVYFLGERSMASLFKYILDVKSPIGSLQKSKNVHVDETFRPDDCLETDIEGLLLILGSYEDITFQISIIMKNDEEEFVKGNDSKHRILTETIQGIRRISINYPKNKTSQKIEIKFNKSSKSVIKTGMISSRSICELEQDLTLNIPEDSTDIEDDDDDE